nr:hypothetical protein [Burkholderia metallica]
MNKRARAWRMLREMKERKRQRIEDEAAEGRCALAREEDAVVAAHARLVACESALHAHRQRTEHALARRDMIAVSAYLDDERYRAVLDERRGAAQRGVEQALDARDASRRALDDTLARLARADAQTKYYAERFEREHREAQAVREAAEEEEAMEGVVEAARRRRAEARAG